MLHEVSLYCIKEDRTTLVSVFIPLWHKVEQVVVEGKVLSKMLGALPFCENLQNLVLTTVHCNDN